MVNVSDAGMVVDGAGLIGGLLLIAAVVYLAVRPYLRTDLMPGARKPWMPDSTGRKSDTAPLLAKTCSSPIITMDSSDELAARIQRVATQTI